ncbi:hypothetical protein K2395_004232 [Salmonella enterica]|nr:hypothetical protein [Escherichia coli]EHK8991971.1 hypothetical protein [Escherichia coli]EHW6165202.1 hypothetical protein [Salmonella enterica]EME5186108.1 hypothetical protein [Escherichia coli]
MAEIEGLRKGRCPAKLKINFCQILQLIEAVFIHPKFHLTAFFLSIKPE